MNHTEWVVALAMLQFAIQSVNPNISPSRRSWFLLMSSVFFAVIAFGFIA